MKITTVRATWLRAPIPAEHAHVSDFGRNDTFNMCLVEIETDTGLAGPGRGQGRGGQSRQLRGDGHADPRGAGAGAIGRDPRDVAAIWELLYSGSRARYATREGRTFPTIGRRGISR